MSAKILVVDDDESLRLLLVRQLMTAGYDVCAAGDAIAAVSTAVRERPDLVLLDLGLPGGNGRVVLERLRGLPATAAASVVVITGSVVDPLTEDDLRAHGCTAILEKPLAAVAASLRDVVPDAAAADPAPSADPSPLAATAGSFAPQAPAVALVDPEAETGRLRSLAHDVNNALGVIVGCAELVEDELTELRPFLAADRWERLAQLAGQILVSAEKGATASRELMIEARSAAAETPVG
jgi:CheY-like chemotaxis protein